MRTEVIISTDGACSGNPGPGGWAAILKFGDKRKEISGFERQTTNNYMELKAVVEAVRALKRPCHIVVETDSKYVCNGIVNGPVWARNKWRLSNNKTPANVELWKELQVLTNRGNHTISYQKIEGHSGNPDNERCDYLAKNEIKTNTERGYEHDLLKAAETLSGRKAPCWAALRWEGSTNGIIMSLAR